MTDAASTAADRATNWVGRLRLSVRWLIVAVGFLALGTAFLVAVFPSAARLLPAAAVRATLGSDYVAIAVIGLFAVGVGAVAFGARIRHGITEANPPAVEGVQSATYPGVAVDRTGGRSLSTAHPAARNGSTDADRRRRLREAAITATMEATDCSRQDAAARVDDGSWTTDRVAAAWLADDESGATASERTVARTVSAITEVADSEGSQ